MPFAAGAAAMLAVVVVLAPKDPPGDPAPSAPPAAPAPARAATAADDPRFLAVMQAYGMLIDSVAYRAGDPIFYLGSTPIHFQGGRMVGAERLDRVGECDPIFYDYPLGPLTAPPPPPPDQLPRYCSDFLESLWGSTEREVRRHARGSMFLDHRIYMNAITFGPLAAVERDIRMDAATDPAVAQWIADISITYSFVSREIAGSAAPSQHGFGLAIDLVPKSYGGRAVYWRWSRALDRAGWTRIPLEQRWSPPPSVVAAFERHGFVWGGKWSQFDAIHFEYRPEIVAYSRIMQR